MADKLKKMEELFLHLSNFPVIRYLCPDVFYTLIQYKLEHNSRLNIINPTTFNEKIQWVKLFNHDKKYSDYVDKYKVRTFIKDRIGEEYLIPLIINKKIKTIDEIDFDNLPEQFVIKCVHDSGSVKIIKNKSKINISEIKAYFNKQIKDNYYWYAREWYYKNIEPGIVIEEYIEDENSSELKDYKFFCFDGQPQIIQVDFDRFTDHKRNMYSIDWELLPFELKFKSDVNAKIQRPPKLDLMIEIAKKLSKDFSFVRVDLYNTGDHIYFGELTFYPGAGYEIFYPNEYDEKIGQLYHFKT